MNYFKQDFLDFFSELEKNNRKEWFDSNKKRYEITVKLPFIEFINEIIGRIKEDDPTINMTAKEAIFRINRDVRFSNDKSPYKSNTSAAISSGGKKDFTSPEIYLELSHKGIGIYGGSYQPDKEYIFKIRSYISENLEEFQNIINAKDFVKSFGTIQGEKNKKIPKEFLDIYAKEPLIVNKQFYYVSNFKPNYILKENLSDLIMEQYYISKPIKNFLTLALNS